MAPRKSGLARATSTKKTKRNRTTQERLEVGEGSIAGATEGEIPTPEPPKKKGRGPGILTKSTDILEDRPIIWPVGNHAFTCESDPQKITASITRLALNHMPGPLRSFHAFDDTTKKNIEFLFLKKYRYREGEDLDHCKHVLHAIAAKRVSEELHEARGNCIKRFGNNTHKWKEWIPHWCLDHPNWFGLCDIFATEAWQGVSATNKDNRTKSKRKIAHHGGSASAHQHMTKLTKLNNGVEPPMRALYIHLHCAKVNGKSPIVAKMEAATAAANAAAEAAAAAEGGSGPSEINEDAGLIDPSGNEVNTQLEALDMNSLQFTNDKTQEVYQKVNDMMDDETNSSMDESTMFLSAVGRSSHGRVKGFGSMLDHKVQKEKTHSGNNHTPCSVSGLTNTGEETNLSRAELQALLADSDRRREEERDEQKRELAKYDVYINQLFAMVGSQMRTVQAAAHNAGTQQGVIGISTTIQGHGSTSQPSHEGGSNFQLGISQGLPCLTPPNQGGSFTALLNHAAPNEPHTERDGMDPWFCHSGFNINRHL